MIRWMLGRTVAGTTASGAVAPGWRSARDRGGAHARPRRAGAPGYAIEHLVGDAAPIAALEARVVLDADARQQRDLFAPQAPGPDAMRPYVGNPARAGVSRARRVVRNSRISWSACMTPEPYAGASAREALPVPVRRVPSRGRSPADDAAMTIDPSRSVPRTNDDDPRAACERWLAISREGRRASRLPRRATACRPAPVHPREPSRRAAERFRRRAGIASFAPRAHGALLSPRGRLTCELPCSMVPATSRWATGRSRDPGAHRCGRPRDPRVRVRLRPVVLPRRFTA